MEDVVTAAIGGRTAGHVFEGDRRFDLVVRLPDACAATPCPGEPADLRADEPESDREGTAGHNALLASGQEQASRLHPGVVRSGRREDQITEGVNQISRENGRRRVVVQCNVRGARSGLVRRGGPAKDRAASETPAGKPAGLGRQFENLQAAQQRLSVVVPLCFFLIFMLLFSTFNSGQATP